MSKTTTDPNQMGLFGSGDPLPGLVPRRKRGSPGPDHLETMGKDSALDNLEASRIGLVEIGRSVAIQLAMNRKRITSVEVFSALRAYGYDDALDAADPRWMGVVFREDIWQREGWETTGSHKRPVAIWSLKDPTSIPMSPRELVYRTISSGKAYGATLSEIVSSTALSGAQVRSAVRGLETLDKVTTTGMKRKGSGRRHTVVYVTPENHPDIV